MNARLTFVHALSPLHAGIGQGSGVIDLPIAREKATRLPYLPGSSLKGALRTRCPQGQRAETFGADPTDEENPASPTLFSDQRLLFLPVRSIAGVFAWVTSPYILQRLARDLRDVQEKPPTTNLPEVKDIKTCLVATEGSRITLPILNNMVCLEDLDLTATGDANLTKWAQWLSEQIFEDKPDREAFIGRICLVHDNLFHFISANMTEVITRIKLQEDAKTVEDGGLWYEEALPTESILSGLVYVAAREKSPAPDKLFETLEGLTKTTLQLGGKATVGRGMCRVRIVK